METYTVLKVTKDKYHTEIKNEITTFIDRYNISFPEDIDYRNLYETYISLFDMDVNELINDDGVHALAFRIVGATRGNIFIKEISRESKIIGNKTIISIQYEIKNIEFYKSTCFDCFKVYNRDVIAKTNTKYRGKKLIINIIT